MDDKHCLYTLQRRYGAVLGELKEARERVEKLEQDAVHLEATIRIFRADWTGDDVAPRSPRKPIRWMRHGDGVATALDVLREAEGPLTIAEIVRRMMERRGITDNDRRSIKSLKTSTAAALFKRLGKGVACEGPVTGPKLWRLATSEGLACNSAICLEAPTRLPLEVERGDVP